MNQACWMCGNDQNNTSFSAKESLMGTGETFNFQVCSSCKSVQIEEIPPNIDDFYSENYYSLGTPIPRAAGLRKHIDKFRLDASLGNSNLIGSLGNLLSKEFVFTPWVKMAGIKQNANIIDVGSGSGTLVYKMSMAGFKNIVGIDPFTDADSTFDTGAKIIKTTIHEFAQNRAKSFDLVMFNHCLEHTEDPAEQIQSAGKMLAKDGLILVRLPIAAGYSQEKYGEHWFHLDPPRHLFVPSLKGFELFAAREGFTIQNHWFESSGAQLINSELNIRGLKKTKENKKNTFSKAEIKEFDLIAEKIDKENNGDCAGFILKKSE